MSHNIYQEPPTTLTRETVANRLVGWLGEGYRGPIESLVDDYAKRFGDDGVSCEGEVTWCVHIAKGHQDVDLEMALLAAEVLGRLGLDPIRVRFMSSLPCVECDDEPLSRNPFALPRSARPAQGVGGSRAWD